MKQLSIKQSNYTDLFNKENSEPILVKNADDNYFLVLPLQQMNWQKIFFHLYKLPSDIFSQKTEPEFNYDDIDNLCGSMKGLLSSSEEFAKRKQDEKKLEF